MYFIQQADIHSFKQSFKRYLIHLAWPDLLASSLLIAIKQAANLEANQLNAAAFLLSAVIIRLVWHIGIIIHGLGHSITYALIERKISIINLENILEHRHPTDILCSLLPLTPILPVEQAALPWIEVGDKTPWKVRVKALGGPIFNLIGLGLGLCWVNSGVFSALAAGLPLWVRFLTVAFVGSNGLILLSSQSDVVAALTGQAERFYCGNFGLIGQTLRQEAQELLPKRALNLYTQMGHETEIRGEQAGGGLTLGRDRTGQTVFVGCKIVNSKRGNLTQTLETKFARTRRRAARTGIKPLESTLIGAWHYRFGTSGPPSVLETHWHEWTPGQLEPVWQIEQGQWVARPKLVNHRITHNGDFEAWTLFGQPVDYAKLGLWLERVLHCPNATVGDSPKIAGMMDLLITQGRWLASVRWAYQMTVARSLEDAFGGFAPDRTAPNTAPSEALLHEWADQFEVAFSGQVNHLPDAESIFAPDQLSQLKQEVFRRLQADPRLDYYQHQLKDFIAVTLDGFLHHDTYRATQRFMAGALGSFGLVTVSTLEPDQIVLTALGQPITLGFDHQQRYAVYASEPSAVDAVLAGQPDAYRLDLNQNKGEIALLGATHLAIYSMTEQRELQDTELIQRWFLLHSHPYLQRSEAASGGQAFGRTFSQAFSQTFGGSESLDPVAKDLQDIPLLLSNIQTTWMNPTSFNRQSAEYLLNFLIAKARYLADKQEKLQQLKLDPSLAESRHVDILITGVENSLWLGERFARDLKAIFPLLSVKTLSANQVLQNLQYDIESLRLAKQSIVFAISQSGQTFPTRQVLYACDLLVRQDIIREFFVLTGEPTSFIGSPLSQPTYPSESFSRRIFTNGSGRRIAEPATASVAATHQTLTELLFYLARQMHLAFPKTRPLGMTLSLEELLVLERTENEFLHQTITEILGATTTGQVQKTRLHRQLIQNGRRWAMHITEVPLAWGLQALYVLITVGWAIPFGYSIPLFQTLFRGLLLGCQISQEALIARIAMPCLMLLDIAIYIFGVWFWTLGLRLVQKRQLLARLGKRSLVIGDVPWVHQILKTYVSKLFSLSYAVTSLDVHGANPQDHLLHHFAHRVVRGSLLFLGVPDGRSSQKQRSAARAVLLTAKQASGIQTWRTGPEIMAIGSNPAIEQEGFAATIVLPSLVGQAAGQPDYPKASETLAPAQTSQVVEALKEARFDSFRRLLASYVLFWALAKRVSAFPFLSYAFWKSQSRTKIMTTAAPVSAIRLDYPEPEEISVLNLSAISHREQS
jgi:hypothetical protein